MKPLPRELLTVRVAVPLVLTVAALTMRVVSEYRWQVYRLGFGPAAPALASFSGAVKLCQDAELIRNPNGILVRSKYGPAVDYLWFAATFGLLTGWQLLGPHWRRRRRRSRGLCESCGYDLWATRQRCPECGHIARGLKR